MNQPPAIVGAQKRYLLKHALLALGLWGPDLFCCKTTCVASGNETILPSSHD